MKRVWLFMALLLVLVMGTQEAVGQITVPVTWTSLVRATATGSTLKNAGGPGSGGMSAQQLASGNGFVNFTVTDPTMDYVVSLGNAAGSCCIGAWALHAGLYGAEVRENSWALMMNTEIVRGDVLGISVMNGQVNYSKNGVTFYTSVNAPVYPLRVFASLWGFGATVSNATLSSTFARTPTSAPTARLWPFVFRGLAVEAPPPAR
jgi:hypothetical protein